MGESYWNGAQAAHRRVMMKAAGYSDEDIRKKPHIGVPNSYMAGSPGTAHLRQVTEAVKEGIWAAGGIPVEFGIPATCGNMANGADEMKYEQVGRDTVAMSIEFVSRVWTQQDFPAHRKRNSLTWKSVYVRLLEPVLLWELRTRCRCLEKS